MTPKELFLQNKERANMLRTVVQQPWFKESLYAVRAQLMGATGMTTEKMRGALDYEAALLDLAEETEEEETIDTGLHHDIDNPTRKTPSKEKPSKKTK